MPRLDNLQPPASYRAGAKRRFRHARPATTRPKRYKPIRVGHGGIIRLQRLYTLAMSLLEKHDGRIKRIPLALMMVQIELGGERSQIENDEVGTMLRVLSRLAHRGWIRFIGQTVFVAGVERRRTQDSKTFEKDPRYQHFGFV